MPMTAGFKTALAGKVDEIITHIGLVNASGTELSGGSPAYARKAAGFAAESNGAIKLGADLTFDIPASGVVAGWRGYSALTGGTDYGGSDVPQESYNQQGQYKLLAASTSISIGDGA
jgi:hypothetical protein